LVLTPQRNAKLRLIAGYFRETPDPDRGYALAALTGELDIPSVKPAMLRGLVAERVDEVLFGYSYDYVGDLAETISLTWPAKSEPIPMERGQAKEGDPLLSSPVQGEGPSGHGRFLPGDAGDTRPVQPHPLSLEGGGGEGVTATGVPARIALAGNREDTGSSRPGAPGLAEIVERLTTASRSEGPRLIEGWLDQLDATGRWALIKLTTGALRIGVSARLTKQALADLGGKPVNAIEEVWHGVSPPYTDLFAWLEGRGPRPESTIAAPFRPVMLSHAISDDELARVTPETYAAEWKWDGIRVQAVRERGIARLYTRTGDDISHGFPDLAAGLDIDGAIDGELLIGARREDGFALGSFSDLQQRLNRKTVSAKLMDSHRHSCAPMIA
jgi:DNA ligase-1